MTFALRATLLCSLTFLFGACHHDDPQPVASCDPNPCRSEGRTRCGLVNGTVACDCDPGHHLEGDSCQPDATCTATTCGGHGNCNEQTSPPSCICDAGYTGMFCDQCASGRFPDGMGGCKTDLCSPNPCASNQVCVVDAGHAVCRCAPGWHDVQGSCVEDTTCSPTSCSMRGVCMDSTGAVVCDCQPGYTGAHCGACAPGYHDDGGGGCTMDPCTPNPCTMPHQGQCSPGALGPSCGCDPGYHAAGDACVVDETCTADSCHGHGDCLSPGGVLTCTCTEGYAGARCDECAPLYHDDGMQGCTMDPCTPNPCGLAHKTTCTAQGATGVCSCDPGYHPDGIGGCSNDPCTPNPCAAQNQACKLDGGGQPVCYTPVCDDGNPCTTDSLAGGVCMHAPKADTTPCSTTLCQTGQTCTAGTCGGGTPRTCDDGNPCTKDSCDPFTGCAAQNDDSLVPADAYACTVDTCVAGVAKHTASNAACDDGKWCTGVENCLPGAGTAPSGCVASQVPVAPLLGANPCSSYRCDEASHGFVLDVATPGTSCDDRVACSTADQCQPDGACRGSLISSCPSPGCLSPSSFAGGIDLPTANLEGLVTLNGAALPTKSASGGTVLLMLKARDTGAEHTIDALQFNWDNGNGYNRASPATYSTRVIPGVYDLVYQRNYDQGSNSTFLTSATDGYPSARRVLRSNVLVGVGTNHLDIDLGRADVSGTVTINGAALPTKSLSAGTVLLMLKARDTGAEHTIDALQFNWDGGSGYNLASPATYSTRVMPGTYDLVYQRNYDQASNTTYSTSAADGYANGRRILVSGVVIPAGATTLDIDLARADVSGTITLNGAALPTKSTSGGTVLLMLKARDTGAEHTIDALQFNWDNGNGYNLASPATYSTRVMPGTYDLVYQRNYDQASNTTYSTSATDGYPSARRILVSGVVIPAGATTLDIDLGRADVSGTITLNGAALPTKSTSGGTVLLMLKARDTGAEHTIDALQFNWDNGNGYNLASPATYSTRVMPGTYDLVYQRNYDQASNTTYSTSAADGYPSARRILVSGVVIPAGATTLDIDLGRADVSGTITLNGAALPTRSTSGGTVLLMLKARDTGAEHTIDALQFNWDNGNGYKLASPATYSTRVMPGTYDLLYQRNYDQASNTTYSTSAADGYPSARRILVSGVVIPAGSTTLDIDLTRLNLSGEVTMDGAALPTKSTSGGTVLLMLKARDTGAEHTIDALEFNWDNGNGYNRASPATYSTRVMPGTYDLLYQRNYDQASNTTYSTSAADGYPSARRALGICLQVP